MPLPTPIAKTSADLPAEQRAKLKQLFPEIFTESRDKNGKTIESIDFDKLRLTLGDTVAVGKERYGLTWAGKADCFARIQKPSFDTLRPDRAASVNFDTAENLILEGDNLEVLKLLQESYRGQVKLIYIDPPYNTGSDLVYSDDFATSAKEYYLKTEQMDAEGRKFSTNLESNGRFHSDWLNMMYPRLFLARNLLKDDGIMLISIDEAEVDNLRHICDEIFGAENFIACMIWEKGRKNDAKLISVGHEYLLVVAKSRLILKNKNTLWREEKPGAREIWNKYIELRTQYGKNDAAIERDIQAWFSDLPKTHPSRKWMRYKRIDANGPWRDQDISWPGGGGPRYDVIHPITKQACKVPERGWIYSTAEEMNRQINIGYVAFRETHTEPPFRKAHLKPLVLEHDDFIETEVDIGEADGEDELAVQVRGSCFYKQSQVSVKLLREMFGEKIFSNPKDHVELAKIFDYVTSGDKDALVLDFFAGSGSSGHAVLDLNSADGGNRKFILVQLPERLDEKNKEQKQAALYCDKVGVPRTIVELTKLRIRKVLESATGAQSGLQTVGKQQPPPPPSPAPGFKAYRWAPSCFQRWDGEVAKAGGPEALAAQLELMREVIDPHATGDDLLAEALLRTGFTLTEKVETLTLAGQTVHAVGGGVLLLCLERTLTHATLLAMADRKPAEIVVLDSAFQGDDALKKNAVEQCRAAGVAKFRTL